MKKLFNFGHWADFAFDYNTDHEKHRVMCNKCGYIAIETELEPNESTGLETYTAYIGDDLVADMKPLSELAIGVCKLPRKCKCGAHMGRKNRNYDMFLPVVNEEDPYPTFVLV